MQDSQPQTYTLFDSATSNGVSDKKIFCKGFNTAKVAIYGNGSEDMTVQLMQSIAEKAEDVDFTSAQSEDNRWDYVLLTDENTNGNFTGDTGVDVGTASNRNKIFNIQIDSISFLSAKITNYVAGQVTVVVTLYEA